MSGRGVVLGRIEITGGYCGLLFLAIHGKAGV